MMISSYVPQTCCSTVDFWYLPISKSEFDNCPDYYPGQTVFHKIKVTGGEVLHPVMVVGVRWDGCGWEYSVDLPPDHPMFQFENCEWLDDVEPWQLEEM